MNLRKPYDQLMNLHGEVTIKRRKKERKYCFSSLSAFDSMHTPLYHNITKNLNDPVHAKVNTCFSYLIMNYCSDQIHLDCNTI